MNNRVKRHFSFLYNPFRNKCIKLPRWSGRDFIGMSLISADPSSADYLIFTVLYRLDSRVEITMCSIDDDDWKLFTFHVPQNFGFQSQYCRACYVNPSLYVVFQHGYVGEFNVKLQEWKLLTKEDTGLPSGSYYSCVCDNEEFIIERWPYRNPKIRDFRRFDGENKRWVKEESLGNQVLFASKSSIYLVEAVGKLSKYANMMYETPTIRCSHNYYFFSHYREHKLYGGPLGNHDRDEPFADHAKQCKHFYCRNTWIMPPNPMFLTR